MATSQPKDAQKNDEPWTKQILCRLVIAFENCSVKVYQTLSMLYYCGLRPSSRGMRFSTINQTLKTSCGIFY